MSKNVKKKKKEEKHDKDSYVSLFLNFRGSRLMPCGAPPGSSVTLLSAGFYFYFLFSPQGSNY